MNSKERITRLKNMLQAPASTSIVAYKTVIEELLDREERYRWHDLRVDPEDLPDDDIRVECRTQTKTGSVNAVFGYHAEGRWCCGMNSNVILWRHIQEDEY